MLSRMLLGWSWLGALAVLAMSSPSARADHIDERLLKETPRIVKFLHEHNYHTVGVVKFGVKKGDGKTSLDVGTLNEKMAQRVANALIINNTDAKHPLTILQDVTKEASKSRGATVRSPKGRTAVLNHAYPVAWGAEKKQPDVLLTGEVRFAKNLKTATVVVQAFDKKNPDQVQEVVQVKDIPTDRNMLVSIGESFVVNSRSMKRGSRDADEAALADSEDRDKSTGNTTPSGQPVNPLADSDELVKLEIFYDGQPVALEPDSASPGELKLRKNKAIDPKEGQKVKFVIKNTGQETVGVVLAINGQNTLFQEDLTTKAPGECTKWVLAPGEIYTVEGFYMSEDGKDVRLFKVLSDEESQKIELSPEHKGIYSLFVFREGAGAMNISSADNTDLSRRPKNRSASAQAAATAHTELSHKLPSRSRSTARQGKGRGIVVGEESGTSGAALNRVENKFDPQPAAAIFIRYWQTPPVN